MINFNEIFFLNLDGSDLTKILQYMIFRTHKSNSDLFRSRRLLNVHVIYHSKMLVRPVINNLKKPNGRNGTKQNTKMKSFTNSFYVITYSYGSNMNLNFFGYKWNITVSTILQIKEFMLNNKLVVLVADKVKEDKIPIPVKISFVFRSFQTELYLRI